MTEIKRDETSLRSKIIFKEMADRTAKSELKNALTKLKGKLKNAVKP